MRSFKAQLDRDRKNIFHNCREFAESKTIGYDGNFYTIPVVLDSAVAKDRAQPSSDHAPGFFAVGLSVYINHADIKTIPRKGRQITIDDALYSIADVEDQFGEIILHLEALDE